MPQVYKHYTYGSSFQAKRAQGERFEKKVVQALKKMGAEAWIASEHRFDIRFNIEAPIMGTLPFTCECKFDDMASSTGNLALQTFDNGKPSGIHPQGPRPDLWVHGVEDSAWFIRTSIIQSLVEMHAQTWGSKVISMGDKGPNAKGILMPITVAKKAQGGTWVDL